MAVVYTLCAFCTFMTMLFFASGVCENGCDIEQAGILSIVSGFMWILAAGVTFKSSPMDISAPKSSCCCCPMPISRITPGESAYNAIPIAEKEASVKEAPDGKSLIGGKPPKGGDPEEAAGS